MAITARAGNLIIVGLEEGNIDRLKRGQPFHHHMQEVGAPFELLIYYGKTFDDLKKIIESMSGPDTQRIDNTNRKKN